MFVAIIRGECQMYKFQLSGSRVDVWTQEKSFCFNPNPNPEKNSEFEGENENRGGNLNLKPYDPTGVSRDYPRRRVDAGLVALSQPQRKN